MADATADEEVEEKKSSKLPLIIGLVLAIAGGGGGFFVVSSGMLGGGSEPQEDSASTAEVESDEPAPDTINLPDVAFVEVPSLVISLGSGAQADHLRFRASLEVPTGRADEVTAVLPRVQDVLNSYLRALDREDFESPGALIRLRAQMLRRIKLVVGEDRVRDLLVLEFVLD